MSAVFEPRPEVDLHSRDSRERLARMLMELFGHWAIPATDQAVLLGVSTQSR